MAGNVNLDLAFDFALTNQIFQILKIQVNIYGCFIHFNLLFPLSTNRINVSPLKVNDR